ncbi:hypothetical protein C7408_106163 [Paraburkholderia caballeronis]|nr:hypothetical protein C7408_106163 [Paraburkholderia caballeronis]TDV17961.1 hypothetical protein C7406_105163 [Paraburkholderia caballeronis]TDV26425.1 hypothetical protein C7404_106128 [Paraburkholderia caballeronis]
MDAAPAEPALDASEHAGEFRIFRKRGNAVAPIALEITGGALLLRNGMARGAVRSLDAGNKACCGQPVEDPVQGYAVDFPGNCRDAQISGELVMRTGLAGVLQVFEHGNGKRGAAKPRLAQARWPVGSGGWRRRARRMAGGHE